MMILLDHVLNRKIRKNKRFKRQSSSISYLMPNGVFKFEEFLEIMDVSHGRIQILIKDVLTMTNPIRTNTRRYHVKIILVCNDNEI
jgi:hypothetical protein